MSSEKLYEFVKNEQRELYDLVVIKLRIGLTIIGIHWAKDVGVEICNIINIIMYQPLKLKLS